MTGEAECVGWWRDGAGCWGRITAVFVKQQPHKGSEGSERDESGPC